MYEGSRMQILRQCDVLIIDEASAMNKTLLGYLDRLLMQNDIRFPFDPPFGGKA